MCYYDKTAPIVRRQLCVLVGAEAVYVGVARAARGAALRAAARLADTLATLLLTAAELHALRRRLRARPRRLFRTLYAAWSHSPVALLALCLLTHNYRHCADLVATLYPYNIPNHPPLGVEVTQSFIIYIGNIQIYSTTVVYVMPNFV